MFAFFKHRYISLKNTGLVLGISAIIFLQLSFTTLISSTDLTDKSSSIIGNADLHIRPLEVDALEIADIGPSFADEGDDMRPGRRVLHKATRSDTINIAPRRLIAKNSQIARLIKPTKPNESRADHPRIQLAPQRVKSVRPFEDIIIPVIPSDAAASTKTTKPKKRSLLASAVPVIKKPFSWIKAAGSKIF